MLKNYIKTALRNLWRAKGFSFINIFGLAIGMACSLLIFLFVKDEKSYDRYNKDAANVYRVVKDFVNDDGSRILMPPRRRRWHRPCRPKCPRWFL